MPPPHHPGSQRKQRDSKTVSYAYDNSGNLATVTDSETGIVTTCYYDLLNRQAGYQEQGSNLDHSVEYEYDGDNNLASLTETVNGITKTYSYIYDDDNRIISETVDGITVEYTYDGFGRLENRTVKNGDTVIQTTSPTYSAGSAENTATGQISSYNGYTYTYDDNGNILTISDGTNTTSYEYDSANQLVRENNQAQGFTHTWTYDSTGNILFRNEYAYTTGVLGELDNMVSYTYGDTSWGDLLTAYDGNAITYDTIGNPLNDGEWTYTWQHGRELVSMSDGTTTWTYTYGADGMRTSQVQKDSTGAVTATYSYIYNGGKLGRMTHNGTVVEFTYDASGTPLTMAVGNSVYYYVTNLQGDIIGIKDSSGQWAAQYTYDAWGNILTQTGTLAALNPLRYRGYVCDEYTGWYYLQSRYYNPKLCRFINADALVSTGQGFLGNNMFAYCGNNPITRIDENGLCYGYPDTPNLNSPYSGVKFGIMCGSYGIHVRHKRQDTAYATSRDVSYEITNALNNAVFMASLHKSLAGSIAGNESLFYYYYILTTFKSLVDHGMAWDIKLPDKWEETIGTAFPGDVRVNFCGLAMTPHELGNFTYGVLGYVYGIPREMLIAGSYYAASFPTDGGKLADEMYDWIFINMGYSYAQSKY